MSRSYTRHGAITVALRHWLNLQQDPGDWSARQELESLMAKYHLDAEDLGTTDEVLATYSKSAVRREETDKDFARRMSRQTGRR